MIIDIRGMNTSTFFEYDGVKFKFHSPYKTYPFNFDFIPKPLSYKLPNGKRKPLPNLNSVAVYPVYSESSNNQIGFTMQHHPNYELEKQTPFVPQNSEFPSKLPRSFIPVDTLRFDTDVEYEHHSPKFLKLFINFLRNFSGQWWIGKIHVDSVGVSVSGSLQINHSITNFKSGSGMYTFKANFGKPITSEIWKKSIKSMTDGSGFDVSRSLLLDAHYDLFAGNYRGVVLNLANAIDISINKVFIKLWTDKGNSIDDFDRKVFVKLYKKNKNISDTFIPGLISEFTKELLLKDYEEEHLSQFKIIDDFWRKKRNPVAHGAIINFDWEEGFVLLDSFEHAINWVNDLY